MSLFSISSQFRVRSEIAVQAKILDLGLSAAIIMLCIFTGHCVDVGSLDRDLKTVASLNCVTVLNNLSLITCYSKYVLW